MAFETCAVCLGITFIPTIATVRSFEFICARAHTLSRVLSAGDGGGASITVGLNTATRAIQGIRCTVFRAFVSNVFCALIIFRALVTPLAGITFIAEAFASLIFKFGITSIIAVRLVACHTGAVLIEVAEGGVALITGGPAKA